MVGHIWKSSHFSLSIGTTDADKVLCGFPPPPNDQGFAYLKISDTLWTAHHETLLQCLFLGSFCWCNECCYRFGFTAEWDLWGASRTSCKLTGRRENSFWQHWLSNYCKKNAASGLIPKHLYLSFQWKKKISPVFSLFSLNLSCFIL